MERLTSERCNGIKTGYWSPAKKEELVQRLAEYENTGLEPEEIKRFPNLDKVVERLRELRSKDYDNSDEEPLLVDIEEVYEEGRSQGRYEAYGKAIGIILGGRL